MSKKKPFAYLKDLGRRKSVISSSVEPDNAFLGLLIGQNKVYLPIKFVYKVLSRASITPVGHTQPWFQGITQVDGNIYGVLNLGRWGDVDIDSASLGNNTLVALSQTSGYYAIVVEEILGIIHFKPEEKLTESTLTVDYRGADESIFSILSVERLVSSPEFSNFSLFNHWN